MKKFLHSKALPIGIITGIGTFLFWISLVGNPHVVETVLGLVLGIIAGGYAYFRLRKLATDDA